MNNKYFLSIIFACILWLTPSILLAATTETQSPDFGASLPKISNPIANPNLSVSIPGFSGFRNAECNETECVVPWIADYIKALYTYGLSIIGILAVIVLMIGGIMWIGAGGKEERVKEAKNMIAGSLFGVIIAASSYMILYIINPALTQLSPIKVQYIAKKDVEQVLPDEDVAPEFRETGNPDRKLGGNAGGQPEGVGAGDYKLPRLYQNGTVGDGCLADIPKCGCGPTSLTMVLQYFGINTTVQETAKKTGKDYSVWDTKCYKDKGNCGWSGGMGGFEKAAKDAGLKSKTGGSSFKSAIELLKYGPVIMSTTNVRSCPLTGGGHYVVLTGYKDGIMYINDPNKKNYGTTNEINISKIDGPCAINAGVIAIFK